MREAGAVLARHAAERPAAAPETEFVLAPESAESAAEIMRAASVGGLRTLIWGGGSHQGRGDVTDPDVLVLTSKLDGVIAYAPDDLTLVVGSGTTLGTIDGLLRGARQTALLPELTSDATVGGVVAAGVSGWQRLRFGPTRDRVLETTLATGDGRIVRGGGRVVKNATGYDLPKLVTGSLGSLGVITSVCLKIWPSPAATATVVVDNPAAAAAAYRPLAVIETAQATRVYLGGRPTEIEAQAKALGGEPIPGLDLPLPLDADLRGSILVPPASTGASVERLRKKVPEATYQAAHGVGEVRFGCGVDAAPSITSLRTEIEAMGGRLVRTGGSGIEPWGSPPGGIDLQRAVKSAFDPMGIANPGRLPGGL